MTADHTAVEDYVAVRSLRDARAHDGDATARSGVATALARAVAAAASLLGPDSTSARAVLHDTAEQLRAVAAAPASPPAAAQPVGASAPSSGGALLDTLERLQKLRESGALTDVEYEDLKHKAMRARSAHRALPRRSGGAARTLPPTTVRR